MKDDQKCYMATPDGTLAEQFMSCNTPLSEREHWARNEITRLRKKPCGMHQSEGNSSVWVTTNCGEIMSGIKLTD